FIDEIDSVLGLSFPTDDFFALIRNCYDKRGTNPEYRRLTFALLGVATPSDLIQDKNSTPFNIGKAIELTGFQLQESAALAEGLVGKVSQPLGVLREVLYWTGGQPFLTQKLCDIIANYCRNQPNGICIIPDEAEAGWVEEFVQKQIVEKWETHDEPEHLKTIRDRLCQFRDSDSFAAPYSVGSREKLLLLYRAICQRGKIPATNSPEHIELRLSGLVRKEDGNLVIYNPIYKLVFNLDWIHLQLAAFNPCIPGSNINIDRDRREEDTINNSAPKSSPTSAQIPHLGQGRVMAAIIFTDVESFTRKMVENEQKTLELIYRDFQVMTQLCQEFEGQIIKSLGDGLLMYFNSAEQAVSAAIAMQKSIAIAASNLPKSEVLRHRIGIHWGEVFFSSNDVMGNGVNMAARLQTQAPAGGICLSKTVYNTVKNSLNINANYGGLRTLKNIPEPVPVYEIPPPQEKEFPVKLFMRKWGDWLSVLAATAIATTLVIGIRSQGWLQPWELQTFDRLMQARPNEKLDDRFVIITITEKDVQAQPPQERVGASLSDRFLDKLLAKLESYQPTVIGLDIYRDRPVETKYRDLATRIAKNERFFAICNYGEPGVNPPPEVPRERQGFNNVVLDSDEVVRRQILGVDSPSPCQNQYSFSWQIATRYLAEKKIEPKLFAESYLQLGSVVFKKIEKNTASYHNIDPNGYQILLNYRATRQIAPTITLTDFINGKFDPNLVKNRIVLIGTTAPSFNDDNWRIPDSRAGGSIQVVTGVEIQAHAVSQILSAVLDNRPLLWWLSKFQENIWIYSWCLAGGILVKRYKSLLVLAIKIGVATVILAGCSWYILLQGGWVPLIPPALAIAITGGCLILFSQFPKK
ncbi:MAG TPA: Chase2 sensor protein, partial [Cyanobacteria bacterium UBA11367]|nr:Chase2 sensor protein [Cyanobacteria bacterium UBA11367]